MRCQVPTLSGSSLDVVVVGVDWPYYRVAKPGSLADEIVVPACAVRCAPPNAQAGSPAGYRAAEPEAAPGYMHVAAFELGPDDVGWKDERHPAAGYMWGARVVFCISPSFAAFEAGRATHPTQRFFDVTVVGQRVRPYISVEYISAGPDAKPLGGLLAELEGCWQAHFRRPFTRAIVDHSKKTADGQWCNAFLVIEPLADPRLVVGETFQIKMSTCIASCPANNHIVKAQAWQPGQRFRLIGSHDALDPHRTPARPVEVAAGALETVAVPDRRLYTVQAPT